MLHWLYLNAGAQWGTSHCRIGNICSLVPVSDHCVSKKFDCGEGMAKRASETLSGGALALAGIARQYCPVSRVTPRPTLRLDSLRYFGFLSYSFNIWYFSINKHSISSVLWMFICSNFIIKIRFCCFFVYLLCVNLNFEKLI